MKTLPSNIFLFPGQGAYHPGALAQAAARWPAVTQTLRQIDEVTASTLQRSVQSLLLRQDSLSLQHLLASDPDALQVAIYAAAIATYRGLASEGGVPSLLLGHSFGEIAALVAAGAFSVADGARIVLHRCAALKKFAGAGCMVALSAPASRCQALLDVIGSDMLAIAVDNGNQTVISGATVEIDRVYAFAQLLGVSVTRLASPYPFHSPVLQGAAEEFRRRLCDMRAKPMEVPVYSPILGRTYNGSDDLAAALASHLTLPVRFADAVRRPGNAWCESNLVFVELGASNALCKLVKQICGPSNFRCHAPFASSTTPADFVEAVNALGGSLVQASATTRLAAIEPVSSGTPHAGPVDAGLPIISRAELQQEIVQLFAEAMEYPPEVFLEHVELEAELGIDSVKQMELLGKLEMQFRLPSRPEDFRLSDYGTLSKITDFVYQAIRARSATAVLPTADRVSSTATAFDQPPRSLKTRLTRQEVKQQIVRVFAEALEYPAEVFTEDVQLEAELGIDSVKQMELLGRLEQAYRLPPRPDDFRLSDYATLGKITDFILTALNVSASEDCGLRPAVPGSPNSPEATAIVNQPRSKPPEEKAAVSRETLQGEIIELFAQAMEYPPEVFTDGVALESELGIDSVKQMELLGKLEQRYRLPTRPEDFRLSDYGTLGKITDFVHQAISQTSSVDTEAADSKLRKDIRSGLTREELQAELVTVFANAMEYPPEVFTEDVEFEAELGIDSVKQMELLGKLEQIYRLPPRPEHFRLTDYGTLRKITDFVYEACMATPRSLQDSQLTAAA